MSTLERPGAVGDATLAYLQQTQRGSLTATTPNPFERVQQVTRPRFDEPGGSGRSLGGDRAKILSHLPVIDLREMLEKDKRKPMPDEFPGFVPRDTRDNRYDPRRIPDRPAFPPIFPPINTDAYSMVAAIEPNKGNGLPKGATDCEIGPKGGPSTNLAFGVLPPVFELHLGPSDVLMHEWAQQNGKATIG